jgi:hypothetical protein
MTNAKTFLTETASTASFAFREYFRPLVAVARFFKPTPAFPETVKPAPDGKAAPEQKRR